MRMPIPIPADKQSFKHCSALGAAVSLPVLAPPAKPMVRPSKMGPRRALVLIAVQALMAAHILLWYFGGRHATVSPVEPSESMYTLERGQLNAGFIFFSVALLATVLLGRFFCGWGCHIVALQDFCGWLMKKCGVHPKPFRSRLLVFAPLVLAFYMFVKPTLVREVIRPVSGAHWAQIAPYVGVAPPRPQLKAAFLKADFWETFATWSVAIPFLALCGFGTVYFLGAKGFCTYGCPYGGFFAPLDALAPGRIRVTDACEHCGHCTAVCTSNVRVHEEVRDFGMVTDPRCMKCMDCVNVCPNDALYFGFGAPALFTAARTPQPSKSRFGQRSYDLSWPQELAAGLLFVALFFGFRGMLDRVPLLMAMGIAGVGTFLTWKLYSMFRTPNVRIQSLQLKLKGRLKPVGLAFGLLTVVTLAAGSWGAVVNFSLWRGNILFDRLTAPANVAFRRDFVATPEDRAAAGASLRNLRRAGLPSEGGIGWVKTVQHYADMAYLSATLGDLAAAELNIRRAIDRAGPRGPGYAITSSLLTLLGQRDAPIEEAVQTFQQMLDRSPQFTDARLILGNLASHSGHPDEAAAQAARAVADRPDDLTTLSNAAQIMIDIRRLDQAVVFLTRYLELDPGNRQNHVALGTVLINMGQAESALVHFKIAAEMPPQDPRLLHGISSILTDLNRPQEAAEYDRRAVELESPH